MLSSTPEQGAVALQMDGWWMTWGWTVGMVVAALLLATAVFVVVRLVVIPVIESADRQADAYRTPGHTASPAEAVLRERYARGEIDEEEFDRRLSVLRDRDDDGA